MPEDLVDSLFRKLRNPDFISMKGLSGEVPFFIHTYDATQEDAARQIASALTTRLCHDGVSCVQIDLLDLILDQLASEGRLDRLIAKESSLGRTKFMETMIGLTDAKTRLVPSLMTRLEAANASISIITGVGRVYPFLRTHSILESLQPAMIRQPLVMFFPGEYTQEQGIGSQLRLFGSLPTPTIYKPYYRAFNLAHYHV
jgi:hypothetical protein